MLNMRLEIDVIAEWLKANKLTLNTNRTKYVIFGTKTKTASCTPFNIKINGTTIEQVSVMKYLGMMLDQNQNQKSRNFLDHKTSITLYKSLVLLHFDYCDIVYDCTSLGNLQKLQKLQNSACRTMLLADNRTPIAEMHDNLQLLTLKQRRELHLSVDCHKHVNISDSSLNYSLSRKETESPDPDLN